MRDVRRYFWPRRVEKSFTCPMTSFSCTTVVQYYCMYHRAGCRLRKSPDTPNSAGQTSTNQRPLLSDGEAASGRRWQKGVSELLRSHYICCVPVPVPVHFFFSFFPCVFEIVSQCYSRTPSFRNLVLRLST